MFTVWHYKHVNASYFLLMCVNILNMYILTTSCEYVCAYEEPIRHVQWLDIVFIEGKVAPDWAVTVPRARWPVRESGVSPGERVHTWQGNLSIRTLVHSPGYVVISPGPRVHAQGTTVTINMIPYHNLYHDWEIHLNALQKLNTPSSPDSSKNSVLPCW